MNNNQKVMIRIVIIGL